MTPHARELERARERESLAMGHSSRVQSAHEALRFTERTRQAIAQRTVWKQPSRERGRVIPMCTRGAHREYLL